ASPQPGAPERASSVRAPFGPAGSCLSRRARGWSNTGSNRWFARPEVGGGDMMRRFGKSACAHGLAQLLCALALLFFTPEPTRAAASLAYRLDAGDTLQVSVFGEPDLDGKFTIGVDGAISYPRLGRVALQGLSAEEAAARLMAGLVGRIPAGHTVSVDVVSHAPVFVTGDVQAPGRYEFRPDMIVLELVALGGGLRRPPTPYSGAALQVLTL